MSYPNEICSMIIRNMQIVEKLPAIVNEIHAIMFKEINSVVQKNIPAEWSYNPSDYLGNCRTWFAPKNWNERKNKKEYANYYIAGLGDGCEYWLSNATNTFGAQMCVGFEIDKSCFELAKTEAFISRMREWYNKNSKLEENGFILDHQDGTINRPFTFSPEDMANEYPNLKYSLQPLEDAMDKLLACNDIFAELVESTLLK